MGTTDEADNDEDVFNDRMVETPEISEVESSTGSTIPPRQEEIGDSFALSRILIGDVEQTLNGTSFLGCNGDVHQEPL